MAKIGSKFNKYSNEFKLKVVKAYLSREYSGYRNVTKLFGIKNKT